MGIRQVAWKHRTNLGRVVYDRPKNFFKCRDISRIVRRTLEQSILLEIWETRDCYVQVVNNVVLYLRQAGDLVGDDPGFIDRVLHSLLTVEEEADETEETSEETTEETEEEGEGQFGGGGATREA